MSAIDDVTSDCRTWPPERPLIVTVRPSHMMTTLLDYSGGWRWRPRWRRLQRPLYLAALGALVVHPDVHTGEQC